VFAFENLLVLSLFRSHANILSSSQILWQAAQARVTGPHLKGHEPAGARPHVAHPSRLGLRLARPAQHRGPTV